MADLRDIVREKGGSVYDGGRRALIPGPGHSKRDRSLSLLMGEGSRVVFKSFSNDSARDCIEYLGISGEVREATPFERAQDKARRERERRAREAADLALCKAIWAGVTPIDGTPVEAYLWSRGLMIEGVSDIAYHSAAPRAKNPGALTIPAMVALVRDAKGGPMGLHLTYITPKGTKAFGARSRLMFGPVGGGAVQIGRPSDGVLAVGEGIETCGAYSTLKGGACWPCLSTAGLQTFVIPTWVRRLVIAADGDAGGMRAAAALAERAAKVCDVEIDPAPQGEDWADVLEGQP